MEAMRQSWTDDRLDDFRGEVNRRFDGVDRRLDRLDDRFDRLDDRFDKLQRTLVMASAGIIATLVAGILSLIGIAVF
jgi:hypothetical protein